MKKVLLFLTCFLACFGMVKAETVTFDFTSNDYGLPKDQSTYVPNPTTITSGDVEATLNGGSNAWRMWSDGLRVYYKNNPTITISVPGGEITAISWTANSGVKFAATSGGTAIDSWSGNAESVTLYGSVGSSNAALQTLTVTYSGAATPGEPVAYEPAWAKTEITMTVGQKETLDLGSKYPSDIIFVPADDDVVSVTDDGVITALAKGTTTVEVEWDADKNFTEGSTYVKVIVNEAAAGGEAGEVTYNVANYNYTNAQTVAGETVAPITFTFSKGSGSSVPAYYNTGSALRLYGGNTMTVSAPEGTSIVEITIGFSSSETSSNSNAVTANVGTFNSPVWTGDAESVVFTISGTSGHRRIVSVNVKYIGGEAPAVLAPAITCENNLVTITNNTEGAEIYYTLDGSDPTTASNKYSAPFEIDETVTVKAIAYLNGESSSVTTYNAVYVGNYKGFAALVAEGANAEGTVDGPITTIYQNGSYLFVVDSANYPMLVFGNVNATFTNGQVLASVNGKYSPYNGLPEITNPVLGTVSEGTPVNPTVITVDQVTTTTLNSYVTFKNMEVSATAMKDGEDNTLALYNRFSGVTIPTQGVYNVTGFLAIFNGTYQLYPVEFEEVTIENQVETPVINPDGGQIALGYDITITCDTEGASIYYTTDGKTTPTTASTPYTGAIKAEGTSMTVKAIAVKEGMTPSYVATAVFTVYDPNATDADFNFTDVASLGLQDVGTSLDKDAGAYPLTGKTLTSGKVSIEFGEKTTTDIRLYNSSGKIDLRLYTGEQFSVIVDPNYHITGITFEKAGGSFAMEPNVGTFSSNGNNGSWTPGEATGAAVALADNAYSDVTFTMTATTRISTMNIQYAEGAGVVTGVEAIGTDNGVATYYNLQGVKVNNPEKGLYIKVVNGKSSKVLVK